MGMGLKGGSRWRCECVCGKETFVMGSALVGGRIRGCGCRMGKDSSHGLYDTKRYAMWSAAKKRAVKKKVAFSLTPEDIPEIPTHCPILGIELFHGVKNQTPNSPSLDRIVPALGYVVGNIQVISQRANVIKNDATVEEVEAVARYMRTIYDEKQI